MTELVRYDAACRAIADAKSVDEVKGVHDRAEAMRAYARQAKNKELEVDAAEIRMRAERRLGEMITDQKNTVGLNQGGRPKTRAEREQVPEPPTLADAGIDRKLSSRAQKMAAVPDDEYETMLADWRGRVQAENERVTVNLLRAGEKKLDRDAKEAALAEKIAAANEALNSEKRFGVIYADPPWRFEPYSRDTGMDRAADNHYPTMDLGDIVAMEVPAADDCVLFLWATPPMLPQALAVMAGWDFEYRSHIIWNKDRIGTGYWSRNKHELLLIGVRGNIPAPEPGTQPASVIDAPVGRHSEKPEIFAEEIERLYPNLPKIELFSRRARLGWFGWGAEAEPEPEPLPLHDPITGEILEDESSSPGPQRQGAHDGEPSIPSSDAARAKSDGLPAVADRAVPERQSEQAVTSSSPTSPVRNERCQGIKKDCPHSHNPHKVTCATCTTAWMIARQKGEAA